MSEKLAILGGPKAITEQWPSWPILTRHDEEVVLEALRGTGTDSVGPGGVIGAFETALNEYQGRKYAIATNGGTQALDLAVAVSGAGPGDEVICTPYTWGASVACVLHNNAVPVFADIDATLNMDPESLKERITNRTKAIVVVHIYGQPADMGPISDIARDHDLVLIEDAAQAIGARYRDGKVGNLGDIGCFSFQASKHVPGIEGGAFVTDNQDFYQHALILAMHPRRQEAQVVQRDYQRYIDSSAYNFRMHPLAAALAKERLGMLNDRNSKREQNCKYILEGLSDVPGIEPCQAPDDREHTYHMMALAYDREGLGGLPRENFIKAMREEGLGIGAYVSVPIHLRPRFQDHYYYGRGCPWTCPFGDRVVTYKEGDCPVAEEFCRERELTIYTGGLAVDCPKLLDQIVGAFHKVASQPEKILELPEPAAQ
jgi:perosamine synthetase